jgi:catechol 2,3-dioxygenase
VQPDPIEEAKMTTVEPIYDVAHLGHVELLTNKPEASLDFFTRVFGLSESGREGDSVYLRAYDDYEFHTLKLTASHTTGVRHVGYRAASPQALQRRVAVLEQMGCGIGWSDGDLGHGPAYRFRDPDDHAFELYYETRRYEAPPDQRPALKNQAQRFSARGVATRRLDHVNMLASDLNAIRDFVPRALGSRITEQIVLDNGNVGGCWFTVNNKSYDIAYARDNTGSKGRFHHVTYAVDQREHILQAADIFLENGVFIETGPHKHAIQQTFFIYAWEPAGNRVELANAGARLILAPDWQTVTWTETERKKGQAWGLKTVESFYTHGTPPVGEAK